MKDSQDILGQSFDMINKGYIPLLMKLDDFKPLFCHLLIEPRVPHIVKRTRGHIDDGIDVVSEAVNAGRLRVNHTVDHDSVKLRQNDLADAV